MMKVQYNLGNFCVHSEDINGYIVEETTKYELATLVYGLVGQLFPRLVER